ncbi:MAG: ABC transporter permease [Oribacterium sp.]|jgi:hypothetical protein|nr:ABC transporter permease [Oribacterium sp.]
MAVMENVNRPERIGRLGQVKVYLGKLFRIFIFERDWKVLPMSAAISLMVAYVVGNSMLVNMEGTLTGAFAFVCVCIWNGFFNSIQVVCRERAIIKREHRAGLFISAYIMAHMLYQAVICLLQVVIAMTIYRLCGIAFPEHGIFLPFGMLEFGFTLWLITYTADMLALMISCIVHSTTTAMTVMPFLLILQLIFAGVIFPMDAGTPVGCVSKLTISKWGTNVICAESRYNSQVSKSLFGALWQFRDVPEIGKIIDYINKEDLRMDIDRWAGSKQMVPEYASTKTNVAICWGILLLFAFAYAEIGVLFLLRVDKDKR